MRRYITSPYGRSCLRLIAALAGLFLTLSGLQAAPAAAEPEPVPGPVRGSAYMGMGVRAHDTVSDPPDVMAPTVMAPSAMAPTVMAPSAMAPTAKATQTEGVDVASYQGDVAWATLWSAGVRWAYTKATEGTSYRNPYFAQQYDGPYDVGMIRGAYHFAAPDSSSGTAQADYFVDHGGGWTADGLTLPGVLDIEWNPYGDACYGKSTSAMVTWIRDFLKRYKDRTHRDAVIYTATAWWDSCTGSYSGFGATNPLWVARYASSVGALPAGWKTHTMWQYTSSGATVGDRDKFNGAVDTLRKFANG